MTSRPLFRAALVACAVGVAIAPGAVADRPAPLPGSACAAELAGFMTLLPDQTTYVSCQRSGPGLAWATAQTPFPPNDAWLSYGPPITLHGQGMRNPNLASGLWRATPRGPETACRATQTTVVEAGVLSRPQTAQGQKGEPLLVRMQPRLFYVELAGDCLWELIS